ncbi:MAG: hypothetical protein HXS44_08945 [Theionarchaea archaeon]|nr:hypothetical protein [Theionarchaea archaeon]
MDDVLVSPGKFIEYMCTLNKWTLDEVSFPPLTVMALPAFMPLFQEKLCTEKVEKSLIKNHLIIKGKEACLIEARVGCPCIALDLEIIITLGGSHFIHVGFAGGLHTDMNPGDIIITRGALNETGIPSLYGVFDPLIPSDPLLTEALITVAQKEGIHVRSGIHWCTDAPYRETKKKLIAYTRMRALCVEMEGSALFAVSKFYGKHAAAVYVVSDIITEKGWHQAWHSEEIKHGCTKAVTIVNSFLQDHGQKC